MAIRYSERFISIQAEGRYVGVTSVFIRMFGCNFRCRNFGRDANDTSPNAEVQEVIKNISRYNSYDQMPLVTTGCDSYVATYPEFKRFAKVETTDEMVDGILDLLPHKEWRDEHLIFTGGEPLLKGWQKEYIELLKHPKMANLKEITFETNGTQPLTEDLAYYLEDWYFPSPYPGFEREITFSVSPKLSCSGEPRNKAIKPEIVKSYEKSGYVYLKYVVATEEDVQEALEVTELYRAAGVRGPVYLMPVGGVESEYNLNERAVAELALKHGLRFSPRLHLNLFGNAWAT